MRTCWKRRGLTLVEVLVVVSIITVVLVTVTGVCMQATRLYARTSQRIEPQASLMLAINRMQREIRQAVIIHQKDPDGMAPFVEIVLPVQTNGMNVVSSNGLEYQGTGTYVCYFLGSKSGSESGWVATPNPDGNTIFRITRIGSSNVPLNSTYSNTQAEIIIEGIVSNPYVEGADGVLQPALIFDCKPLDASGSATHDTRVFSITLTRQYEVPLAGGGKELKNHTLSTAFCLRNNPNQ